MDAATATIIVSSITTLGSVIVAIISNRHSKATKLKYLEQQKELEHSKIHYANPQYHYFFGKMAYFRVYFIPALKATEDIPSLKMSMLKKFLKISCDTFYEGMHKWVDDHSNVKLTETAQYICSLVANCKATALACGVPQIFISSFTAYHTPFVRATLESLEQIMRSETYDNSDKENAVLDTLLQSFTIILFIAERTAKEMNGELETALSNALRQSETMEYKD